jgi:hypothetical protein
MRHPTCGAKTRSGTACGRPAGWGTAHAGEGRCKLHGGSSPRGLLHPRFRHGRFARYEVRVTAARIRNEGVMVGDGMLWFDGEGVCLGLAGVVRDGKLERYDPMRPLRPQDAEKLGRVPGYTVTIRERGEHAQDA